MKNLELYCLKFEKDKFMKINNYPNICITNNNIYQLFIVIIYDKCKFSGI